MNRFTKNILILLVCVSSLNAQHLFEVKYQFKTILENGFRVNPYFVGHNPAYLHLDDRDELLWIQGAYSNEYGSYKRFIDPSGKGMYQINFSGKKVLGNSQIFKGNFAVQRIERRDWDWLAVRNYDIGSPFLLGDSTSGKTRYNGILVRAEYAARLFENLLVGFQFDYTVDEGLKEVAPRPTTEHRDIDLSLGLGYDLNRNISVGLKGRFFDLNETIFYREDEGALTQETILFKFRGYDHPFVVRKKVETRYSFHNGYYGGFNINIADNSKFAIAAYFDSGFEQLAVKDDANNPQPEGFWKQNRISGGFQSRYAVRKDIILGLKYDLSVLGSWHKHPEYDVLLGENDISRHEFSFGLEYILNETFDFGAEAGYSLNKYDSKDYYSSVLWKNSITDYSLSFGGRAEWSSDFSTTIVGTYSKQDIGGIENSFADNSKYFSDFRIDDILYYQSPGDAWKIYSKIKYYPGFWGDFYLYLIYKSKTATEYFQNGSREYFNIVLELRMKVY